MFLSAITPFGLYSCDQHDLDVLPIDGGDLFPELQPAPSILCTVLRIITTNEEKST